MTMHGSCSCGNFKVRWQTVDYSVVPRQCQCDYCLEKGCAYVSKSGSRIDVSVARRHFHRTVRQGSKRALFHECGHCGDLVLVTVEIEGEVFGALNASCMTNRQGFSPVLTVDFSHEAEQEKVQRWSKNWCSPVRIQE